jgi:hypothetical protein
VSRLARSKAIVLALAVGALTGCGRATPVATSRVPLTNRVVSPADWKAVLEDWYVGGLDHRHSCGAVVVAISHLPVDGPVYSTVFDDLRRYAGKVCPKEPAFGALRRGMTDRDVAAVAGMPEEPAFGCWLYPVTRRHTGRRVCFRRGRVSVLQVSVHL